MDKQTWIDRLHLEPHVEGGWFTETYRSTVHLGEQSIATSIYFLVSEGEFSAYHRLTSDELWFFHTGDEMHLSLIDPEDQLHDVVLHNDPRTQGVPYYAVPAGWIFGSYCMQGASLVSCVVAPGFSYEDFQLFERDELLRRYPQHDKMIRMLTRK